MSSTLYKIGTLYKLYKLYHSVIKNLLELIKKYDIEDGGIFSPLLDKMKWSLTIPKENKYQKVVIIQKNKRNLK